MKESALLRKKFKDMERAFKEGRKDMNEFKKGFIAYVENSIKMFGR